VVFHVHYDNDQDKGNPRIGWACVLTINDLAKVLPDPLQESAAGLLQAWGGGWENLADSTISLDIVMQALDAARSQTLELLRSLE
jgi:hypothetical protein